MSAFDDVVNSPRHYKKPGAEIEAIDALKSALGKDGFIAYCRGNAMKYIWRCDSKGKMAEDLRKAQWYISKILNDIAPN